MSYICVDFRYLPKQLATLYKTILIDCNESIEEEIFCTYY